MNRISKLILSAVIFLPVISGCSRAVLDKSTFVVELGSDVYNDPAIYLSDPSTANSSMKIVMTTSGTELKDSRFVTAGRDYLVVGEYDMNLINHNRENPFILKIKDTLPPQTELNPNSTDAYFGQNIDWQNVFQAHDLSGVYYQSDPDLTASYGEHETEVRISDRFGNSVNKKITVNVR